MPMTSSTANQNPPRVPAHYVFPTPPPPSTTNSPPLNSTSNFPRGRHLIGKHLVYDVDVRFPGEIQPQLEVSTITKYGSDPALVLGSQIAVNNTYVCYGLKLGAIRVLNVHTACRSLLKGFTQRVADMAFLAEDINLLACSSVDGRVYVWEISEGPDEEDNPHITGTIIIAVQIVGHWQSAHPRLCWHCHKEGVLVVGIDKYILMIDAPKIGKGEKYSAEKPLVCPISKLTDGIQLVGQHRGNVTDLSVCQWMTTRLVSASVDGTVKIWEDQTLHPIAELRPHDGQPVYSVTFLAAADRPDHIILITGSPLNREIKIWSSGSKEGWLLPSHTESWSCNQTLEFKSCRTRAGHAFFNQVVAFSQTGIFLVANAKRNAIYAVHLDYGSYPAATRMDYIAEFTVTMPILSFTGATNLLPHGEHILEVYCVHTHAIQQYVLDLCQCLPPPLENAAHEKSDSSVSGEVTNLVGLPNVEFSPNKPTEMISFSTSEPNPSPSEVNNTIEHINVADVNLGDAMDNTDSRNLEVEVKVVGDKIFGQNNDDSHDTLQSSVSNNRERSFCSQASDIGMEMVSECRALSLGTFSVGESKQYDATSSKEMLAQSPSTEDKVHGPVKNDFGRAINSAIPVLSRQLPSPTTKGEKQKGMNAQGLGSSSPSPSCSAFKPADSSTEPGIDSTISSTETTWSRVLAMQGTLNQLMSMQKDMQKQLSMAVTTSITKEGRRLEAAAGRNMEKTLKANSDALWAQFQEESFRQEKLARGRTQQIRNLVSDSMINDFPVFLEKSIKNELTAVGHAVARTVVPTIEKTISTAIKEAFQKGFREKVVNQLEKSVYSKLEATVARQIQAQFQTSGKQALQESLRSSLESYVIPAFEMSCRSLFEQVEATFQKGMAEYMAASQQKFESTHSPLALTLREAINSASSLTQTLSTDLSEGHRKLFASLPVSVVTPNTGHRLGNGPLTGLHEQTEPPVDPMKELSRMIGEHKFEEAFTAALQRSDVYIVSWLCSQGILTLNPLPLSQGVLLSLTQQLVYDISTSTPQKLSWMRDVLSAIDSTDPMIVMHIRPIFEQVHRILNHHQSLPTTSAADISSIRLLLHVINSMLITCNK